MAKFVLVPCRIRQDRLVPSDEPETLTWKELEARLAPSGTMEARMTLRGIRPGAYIGLMKDPMGGSPKTFFLMNQDRSGKISWLVRKQANISEMISEVYRVESVAWDAKYEEVGVQTLTL